MQFLRLRKEGVSDTICIGEPEKWTESTEGPPAASALGRYDYVSEHGLPFLPPLAVSPGEQEENVSGVRTTINDCELETKQCENGEIVPVKYLRHVPGNWAIRDGTSLHKGGSPSVLVVRSVTITQKERKEVFYANGSTAVRELLRQEHFR